MRQANPQFFLNTCRTPVYDVQGVRGCQRLLTQVAISKALEPAPMILIGTLVKNQRSWTRDL